MSGLTGMGCCHLYNECSDQGTCINREFINDCMYWIYNLSKGRVFYGRNPGIRAKHIYLIIQDRAFRVSKTSKGLSYTIDELEVKALIEFLEKKSIRYDLDPDKFEHYIEGTEEAPAQYRLEFTNGEFNYNIRNYNGYELQDQTVRWIRQELKEKIDLQIINQGSGNPGKPGSSYRANKEESYCGRETVIVFEKSAKVDNEEIETSHEEPVKEQSIKDGHEKVGYEKIEGWDLEQISIFGTLLDKGTGVKHKNF